MAHPAGHKSLYFDYPHYPFVAPPEMAGEKPDHPVAIVGGGPVGLAAALELSLRGIPVVVLQAADTVSEGSRALCISRHSLEILARLGVADRFISKGLAWQFGRSFYRDKLVYQLKMPHSDEDRFYPMINLQQCYIELFLIEALQATGFGDIRWQSEVTAIRVGAESAVLSVATPEGDYEMAARFVVAADGARSRIRDCLGLKLSGTSYEGRYLIADIKLDSQRPIERLAFFDPVSNPGSTVLMHKQPDQIWRIDYQLNDEDEEAGELVESRIRGRIQAQLDMIDEAGAWELEWYSLYKAHCLALDDYRAGPVFFAGDAAHLVPIFGVRGLNSGFADANNLGWKLAAVLKGDAPARLLDSYSPERRNATLDIFSESRKSTLFMTPPSRGYRLLRDAALSLAVGHDFTRGLVNPRQTTPYDYTDSPLTGFTHRDREFSAGPRAGAPLEDLYVGDGPGGGTAEYLLDHVGGEFAVLFFSDDGSMDEDLRTVIDACDLRLIRVAEQAGGTADGILINDPDRRLFEAYGADPGSAYLVRPDAHVAARWRQADPGELRQAWRRARGEREDGLEGNDSAEHR